MGVVLLYFLCQLCAFCVRGFKLEAASFDNTSLSTARVMSCDAAECLACDRNCPSEDRYTKELRTCKGRREFLENSLDKIDGGSLLDDCAFEYCYLQRKQASCGIGLSGSISKQLEDLEERVAAKQKEADEVDGRYLTARHEHETSDLFRYHMQLSVLIAEMNDKREEALQKRSENEALHAFISSYEFRERQQTISRLRLENDELKRQKDFWESTHKGLSLAVRTSPRAMREARDKLKEKVEQLEADAALIQVVRESGLTREGQVKLVKAVGKELEIQLEQAVSINAQVKAEGMFITKARDEIYKLLIEVLNRIRREQVECGSGALGRAVGGVLMS